MILLLGLFSVASASGQERSPTNLDQDSVMTALDQSDQTSDHIFATLKGRIRLFEVKAQLATQCAKGLRLIENVMKLTEPNEDDEEAEWARETFFLVHTWFEEQEKEWYFAGKEFAVSMGPQIEQAHSKEEAMETYKRGFALIMNAQIAALEKMSHDLDARIHRLQEPRSAD